MPEKFGPWDLSEAETIRLKDYAKLEDLVSRRAGAHDPLFRRDKKESKDPDNMLQLWIDIPSLVCRVTADLILPKPPVLKSQDKSVTERLAALLRRSNIRKLAWRSVFWTAAQGDAFLVIADVKQKDSKSLPVISLRRATNSVARNIRVEDAPAAREFMFSSQTGNVSLFTHYAAGKTTWHAYQGDKKVSLPDGLEPEVATREDVPLVVHLAALRGDASDAAFGESDFAGTEELCFEIANRNRQVQKILDRHSEPAMNVPDGAIDEENKFNVRQNKVFERGVDGQGMEYVTWQSQLVEAYTQIDKLTDLILLLTETPPALWGRDKNGQAESGRALKFRLLSGLGKARRTGGMLSEALIEAARIALRREDILAGRNAQEYDDIECELSANFIVDEQEVIDRVMKLRQAGAMSVQRAVEEGQGLQGSERDEEVSTIAGENPQQPLGLETGRFTGAV